MIVSVAVSLLPSYRGLTKLVIDILLFGIVVWFAVVSLFGVCPKTPTEPTHSRAMGLYLTGVL